MNKNENKLQWAVREAEKLNQHFLDRNFDEDLDLDAIAAYLACLISWDHSNQEKIDNIPKLVMQLVKIFKLILTEENEK